MKDRPYVAVDCIIFGFDPDEEELKLLLLKNDLGNGKQTWSLMSGYLETDETTDDSAHRILSSLTGITNIYMEQLQVFTAVYPEATPRTIAVAYYALINISENREFKEHYSAQWVKLSNKPKLVFDHDKMVEKAIKRLHRRAKTQPIGFKLLPEKFTLRQLQKLYEEILNEDIDKRNFLRKVLQMGIMEKLNEKDKTSSRKGSFLYRFIPEKYEEIIEQGLTFKVQ